MSSRLLALTLAATAFVGIACAAEQPTFVSNEILIKVAPNSEQPLALGLSAYGATEIERVPELGWVRVRIPSHRTPDQAVNDFRRMRFVQKAERNVIYYPHAMPNDPMTNQQWVINRIKLPEAWDITTGSTSVKIAIIDTGVQMNHPDLMANLGPGRDVVDDDNDPTDEGGVGHGTHVAGIASGATNNAVGIAGTGYNCKIMPIRAGDFGFSGADLIEAITWAANNGAQVINMSLGGPGASQAILDACNYAFSRNSFICASSGNNGSQQKSYPAAYPGVMAVGSSDPDDSRSGFSQWGNWVHVAAPGSQILSCVLGGGYESWDGTSMSCPVVAGVAGLVWSKGGLGMNRTQVFNIIANSCDPAPGNYVIYGRVNAYEALRDTRIVVTEELPAVDVEAYLGQNQSGGLASIQLSDSEDLSLDAEVVERLGKAAGIEVKFDMDYTVSQVLTIKFNVRSSSTRNTTAMLWLWNVQQNRWDFIKSFPVKPFETDFTVTANKNTFNRYRASDGTVLVRLRGHIPHRTAAAAAQFNYKWDKVAMAVQYEQAP